MPLQPATTANQPTKSAKKVKTGKYCTLCAATNADERFIHSHNAEDCGFKERYAAKLSSGKNAKKESKARGSGRSVNMLKKEKRKLKKVMKDDSLTAEHKQRRINQILDGGSSRKRKRRYSSSSSSDSSKASSSSSDSE